VFNWFIAYRDKEVVGVFAFSCAGIDVFDAITGTLQDIAF
jgi:hypothetical protein